MKSEEKINISKLEDGMIIKNYKELCKIIDVKPKSGMGKENQLEFISQFCNYEKVGHSFKILSVDKSIDIEKLIKLNKLSKSGARYINDIEVLILHMLSINQNGELIISKSKLLKELDMVNNNYHFCKSRTNKLSTYLDIDNQLIEEWYHSTNSMLSRNLEKAFEKLVNRSLIDYNSVRMVCEQIPENGEILKNVFVDEYEEERVIYSIQSGCDVLFRQATYEENEAIRKYEYEYKNGVEDSYIVASGKWDEYKNYVNSKLLSKHNISFYYNAYCIQYNHKNVINMVDNLEQWEIRKTLNSEIMDKIKENVIHRQNKFISSVQEDLINIKENEYTRADDNYLHNNMKLNLNLIDKNKEDITIDIKGLKRKPISDKYINVKIED